METISYIIQTLAQGPQEMNSDLKKGEKRIAIKLIQNMHKILNFMPKRDGKRGARSLSVTPKIS